MLVLLFYLGKIMYAVTCEKIREITPMVALKEMPHTPGYFAGLFNYRGMIVPVIDLCRLIHGYPCQMRLSTRIILVDYLKEDHTSAVFGLIAERVTEAVRKPKKAFVSPGVSMQEFPFLGGIIMDQNEMIQFIDVDRLPSALHFPSMFENGKEKEKPEELQESRNVVSDKP